MSILDEPVHSGHFFDTPDEEFSTWAYTQYLSKYSLKNDLGEPQENWYQTTYRVATTVMGALGYASGSMETIRVWGYMRARKFIPGGRYLANSGRGLHQTNNCVLLRVDDSREGWAELAKRATMSLMTGAGLGVDYSALREHGALIRKTGGTSSGPIALMRMINEVGRNVMSGGSRRSAIWAGLSWKHPDIFLFMEEKQWSDEIKAMKAKDFNFPAPLDMTNISVILDDDFFEAYRANDERARAVYDCAVRYMVTTGEPGFSIDTGPNAGETLRNACTEITSADDNDICNIGSVNFARIESKAELANVVDAATLFLLAGSVYSDLPYPEIGDVRAKNRRLGLGILGLYEWLLQRDKPYGPDAELGDWLDVYGTSTEVAHKYADQHGISRPIKTRAIAPNGTIGIIAETTTGIEPIFCIAIKRRFLEDGQWVHQYVVDPTAKRAFERGVKPWKIDDAYTLAENPERRIEFQAWVQKWVDHGIASTINLPRPLDRPGEAEAFGNTLMVYLPELRGITCYPDGARGGQPLTRVALELAMEQQGVTFQENGDPCVGGVCGA